MEKITVIIPVYNAEKYIQFCIESVIHQTYENLEILVILDGTTDSSRDILKEYAKKDTRIRMIERENKGIFYTRIEGIKKATSQYIYFLDADDWIEKETIEIMYQSMKKYQANIVRCKNYYKDENKKVGQDEKIEYWQTKDFNANFYQRLFGTYDFACIWNQLIEKKFFENLEKIDYTINFGEDYLLNLNIYKNIDSLVLIPNYFYHYRTNNESITNQQNYEGLCKKLNSSYKSHAEIVKIINQYDKIEQKDSYEKLAIFRMIRVMKNRMIEFASFAVKQGRQEEAKQVVEKIVKQKEFYKLCENITQKELLLLAKQENHKYVMKNIYQKNIKNIMNYIKRIYIPGKEIKKMIRR
ncbi:MAG: glycosyltransferase family 2 protein [Clostridia bacterium]|nr:glycosyltransferase family 2 protein [Clostridia bacterium]